MSDASHLTAEQQVAQCKAYAAANKVDFIAAYKALGFDEPAARALPAIDGVYGTKAEQLTKAKAYAAEKGIGFVEAYKQLGFDSSTGGPSQTDPAQAR